MKRCAMIVALKFDYENVQVLYKDLDGENNDITSIIRLKINLLFS